jgi:hypothetical protein
MSTNPSIAALEADIAARRERLARTIDELTAKATPKAIAQRQADLAKARFADATTTPQGDLRVERVAAVVAVVALVVAMRVLRRRSRRR